MEIGRTLAREDPRASGAGGFRRTTRRRARSGSSTTPRPRASRFVPYDAAVEEALCFGWIDGIVKKLEADSRAQRFTPRRAKSAVSELNKERMRRMIEAGKMTEAGLAAAPELLRRVRESGRRSWRSLRQTRWSGRTSRRFPETYRRIRVAWIQNTTGNADVRRQRLDYLIKMTRQNKQFGTMP